MSPKRSLRHRIHGVAGTLFRGVQSTREAAHNPAFDREGLARCRRGVRAFCLVSAALFAMSAVVSYISAPPDLVPLLAIRLTAILSLCLVVWLLQTSLGHSRPREIGLLATVLVAVALELLAQHSGGLSSYQHDRSNVVVVGAAFLMTWSPLWTGAVGLLVMSTCGIVTLAAGHNMADPRFLAGCGLLFASGAVGMMITSIREGGRWREFRTQESLDRVQREVLERERRYRSLFDTAGSAIVVLSPDHRILEFNPEAERMSGWQRHEVIGKNYLETLVSEGDRAAAAAEAERVLAGHPSRGLEGSIVRRDGSRRVVLWNNSRLCDADGNCLGIIAAGVDITERREAEKRVRLSEHQFRTIFEHAPVMIRSFDETGRCKLWNRECERTLGWSRAEIEAADDPLALCCADPNVRDALREAMQRADGHFREYEVMAKDRSIRNQLWADFRLPDGSLISVGHDLTERKSAEIALRAREEQLRRLLESTKAIPWEASAQTWRFTYVGPQALGLLGYPVAEWYGEDFWAAHMHPEDREWVLAYCHESSGRLVDYDFEYRMIAADGRTMWLHDLVSVEHVDGVPRTLRGFMIDITARKDAEAALRKTQAEYEDLYQNAPDMFLSLDLVTGAILKCNRAVLAALGYSTKELLGRPVFDLHPPEDLTRAKETLHTVAAAGEVRGAPLQLVRKDGSKIDISLNMSTVRDADGNAPHARGICRDVTELKRTTEALRDAEAEYEDLYDNAPDMFMTIDVGTGKVVRCNQQIATATGYTKDEIVGHPVFRLYHPTCHQAAREATHRFVTIGEVRDVVLVVQRKDGSTIEVMVNASAIRAADGRILQGRTVWRDVTELKRTQDALRVSREEYEDLYDNSPVILIAVDAQTGRILKCNRALSTTMGYSKQAMLGRPIFELHAPDDRVNAQEIWERILATGEVAGAEVRLQRKDGEEVLGLLDCTTVRDEQGNITIVRGVCRDVTVQMRAEHALRQSESRYRGVVQDQTELICRLLSDGTFTFVNEAYCRYFDTPVNELVGHRWRPPFAEGDLERAAKHFAQLGPDCPTATLETRILGKDGKVYWQQWSTRAILDDNGAVVEFQSVGADVTAAKLAEQALQRSEARYRAIVEDQTEFIFRSLPDSTLTFVNGAFCRHFDTTPEEAVGLKFLSYLPEKERAGVLEHLTALTPEQPVSTSERRVVGADGVPEWRYWINRAIFDDAGNVIEFQGVGSDVTDRKRAEEALRQSEARYRAIIEDQTEFICRWLADTTVTFVNGEFCRYFEMTREQCIGRKFGGVIPEADLATMREAIAGVEPDTPVFSFERRVVRSDGKIQWRRWTNRAIFDESGRVVEYQSVGRDITDRKVAEEALQRSEARYRAIVGDQTELICRSSPDGVLTFVNDAYCRYFRKTPDELLGSSWRPLVAKEDLRSVTKHIASLNPDRPIVTVEERVIDPDGELRWQQWTNRAIFNDDGHIVELQCVGRDITARKRAEDQVSDLNAQLEERVRVRTEELQKSEERFRSVFVAAPIGMVIAGPGGQILGTNPGFQNMVGYTDQELRAMRIAEVTHPDDVEESANRFRGLQTGERDFVPLEKRYVRPDGRIAFAKTAVTAVRDDAGGFLHAFAMIEDVTEHKQEEALRQGEQRALEWLAQHSSLGEALGALIESIQGHAPETICSVLLLDQDGKRLRYAAASGLSEQYIRKIDGVEIGPRAGSCGAAAHHGARIIVEDIATDPSWEWCRELALGHGLRACWSQPIFASSGQLVGTLAMYHGRTLRPTESEIRFLTEAARVASIVIERWRAMDLLRRHQLELAHVGRVGLVGALASSLAHELHQPLAAIANYGGACVRRIHSGELGAKELVYPIEQMRTLALRSGEIIRGLRTLVRNGDPHRERIDINKLVHSCIRLAQPEARQQSVSLHLDLASRLPVIEVDSVQIEQVILNLVHNSIEAMSDAGRGAKDLVVRSFKKRGGTVGLAVSDTGRGLPSDMVERVFDPFFSTKPKGLGMGLAISRTIIENEGGRMWAISNPAGGATFQFTLPVASRRPRRATQPNGAGMH